MPNSLTPNRNPSQNQKPENRSASASNALFDENPTKSNAIQIPEISLPKGGGALKGIDEKFQVNTANGTAGFSIPLPVTPGRNGFSPSLSLTYNSGAGNSPYGLGWSLDYPAIQRKTDKRLPRYRDEDVFMFSGAEDLVPVLQEQSDGSWQAIEITRDEYRVKSYRPRIEGTFDRIERITHPIKGTYWKVTTRNNVATIFGRNANSRIADPQDQKRISHWLPEFSYDDRGNWIAYEYKEEDLENVPRELSEANRLNRTAPFTNKYLKQVRYGNRRPYDATSGRPEDPPPPRDREHFFSIVCDYGEHNPERPTPEVERGQKWHYRPDAFSSYRTGFEIRTNRLCRRILVFHQFEELGVEPHLVRSLDFQYAPSSINQSGQAEVTYLESITQIGYVRKADGSYSGKSLPPMEFDYQRLEWNKEIRLVDRESIVHAPVGLTNNYQWIDLYGEGVSGIFTEQAEGWYYKSNLGDVAHDGNVRFTPARRVLRKPSFAGMTNGVLSLQDIEANGQKQVVVNSDGLHGYFELTTENDWNPFRPFSTVANLNLQDPNTRLIDLDGDGRPELVVTQEHAFVWYGSNGKAGHKEAEWVSKTFDEERGPALVFADSTQTIFLADMNGDGLTDIVRIRNGEVSYWANKGYGSFSARITMANSPWFDHREVFNPSYLHLADVSGTGATDLIYAGKKTFKAFLNLSGNAWSDAHEIEPFPQVDSESKISVVDLLGTGTSCVVWSSAAPREQWAPMRYIDLMGSRKPHVLKRFVNNLGKETRLDYKSSSWFYLKDKQENRPWITRLPFPVQVVSEMIVEEKVTDVRFSTEYRYHHGYYDHEEREFRGFGMVEQIDTEVYETWSRNNAGNQLEPSEELYQKPVLTRTWFHTGAFLDRKRILTHFRDEYWDAVINSRGFSLPVNEPELRDARVVASPSIHDRSIVDKLMVNEWREALRACKGLVLRQEVFALDAAESGATREQIQKQLTPYTVATHNCLVQLVQPRGGENKHAVFSVTESEAVTFHYERDPADPRVAHTLNIKVDELGNVLEAASVVYPKQRIDSSLPREVHDEQRKTLITYTRNVYTNDLLFPTTYRLRLPAETKTYEITNLTRPDAQPLYRIEDFNEILERAEGIEYQSRATSGATQRRLIEHVQTSYYNDELTTGLDVGTLGRLGLSFESYQLAFTPNLLRNVFADKLPADAVALQNLLGDNDNDAEQSQCKFVHRADANWWIRSGTIQYLREGEDTEQARRRFISPISYTDPFGSTTSVSYYRDYFSLVESVEDELQNRTKVERFNFRTLAPERMRDPNDNLSSVLIDELGLIKATALEGKDLDGDGVAELEIADNLQGLAESTEGELSDITTFFASEDSEELERIGRNLLRNATGRFVYDFDRYRRSQLARASEPNECARTRLSPTVAASIVREEHHSRTPSSRLQLQFEYSDGLGKVAMTKAQAEPGVAKQLEVRADCSFTVRDVDTARRPRWIGNGRTVLNNKGKPVKQYEPYFSVTPQYENARELVETGVTPVLFYDSLGRLIKSEFPDQTFSRTEFDAWQQASYDQNDTVRDSDWYDKRIHRRIDAELIAAGKDPAKERTAAEKAGAHHGTPSITHLDTLGRPILTVEHNRIAGRDEFYRTRVVLDIEGNVRSVVDARGNTVTSYKYDMLGHRVYVNSMDAGERWMLNNVAGKPIRGWDTRGHTFLYTYDVLQRPLKTRLEGGDGPALLSHEVDKFIYGEAQPDAKRRNLRTKPFQHYDSSGLITNDRFDLKGNLLRSQRRLASHYQAPAIDWSESSSTNRLEEEVFTKLTEYDALNRMTRQYNWHRINARVAVYEPAYNERGLLQGEDLIIGAERREDGTYRGGTRTTAISGVTYSEKGELVQVHYGNGTTTRYKYDPLTFRLQQLRTTRPDYDPAFPSRFSQFKNDRVVQNLFYTFDPPGNVIEVYDDAYEPAFFRNQMVEPQSEYTYDALYRLIEATGRENSRSDTTPGQFEDVVPQISFPVTDQALRGYTQHYTYDSVGNIGRVRHVADRGSWTRDYEYARDNNRLLRTWTGGDETNAVPYSYDLHGNMLNLNRTPEEYRLIWNYRDMIHTVNLGGGGRAFYNYDSGKQRSRKRIDRLGGVVEERLYLDGMEVYRRWQGSTLLEEIETYHLFAGEQRMLLVEDVLRTDNPNLNTGILYRYQYSNHLGSTALELDGDAGVISYEEYHPYGTSAYRTRNPDIKATAKRYRFTGMERDEESGLSYHSERYYAPWLGRWSSADPSGLADGPNLYQYASARPLSFVDPSGTQSVQLSPRQQAQWEAIFSGERTRISPEQQAQIIRHRAPATRQNQPHARHPQQSAPELVGGLQLVGGGAEMYTGGTAVAVGVSLLLAPDPTLATKAIGLIVLGGVLLLHGGDTAVAGGRTLWTGQAQHTGTYSLTNYGARRFGASPFAAHAMATGVDFAAGLGPSIGIGLTRRAVISGIEVGQPQVSLAYMSNAELEVTLMGRPAAVLPIGHTAVQVTTGRGATGWYHLLEGESWAVSNNSVASGIARGRYAVTSLRVTPQGAAQATEMAENGVLLDTAGEGFSYLFGPNCTTTSASVIRAGGVYLPGWASRSPFLLNTAMRNPFLVEGAVGSGGSVTNAVAGGGTAPPDPQPTPQRPFQ